MVVAPVLHRFPRRLLGRPGAGGSRLRSAPPLPAVRGHRCRRGRPRSPAARSAPRGGPRCRRAVLPGPGVTDRAQLAERGLSPGLGTGVLPANGTVSWPGARGVHPAGRRARLGEGLGLRTCRTGGWTAAPARAFPALMVNPHAHVRSSAGSLCSPLGSHPSLDDKPLLPPCPGPEHQPGEGRGVSCFSFLSHRASSFSHPPPPTPLPHQTCY